MPCLITRGYMLGPNFWLFTVEDISDFWLSTWEDMVIYGNIKSESIWIIGTLRTHWKHLEWDHWNLELHLWPLEPKFGAPFFWGTGNGRAPYVDWELAMGDDWSDLMSNATRLLIRLNMARGSLIKYQCSILAIIYIENMAFPLSDGNATQLQNMKLPPNPSVFTILGVVCRWFVPLSNNMAGTIGLNDSGKWSQW